MADALIGYSGFVGSTLLRQRSFDLTYRSTNISSIQNHEFDLVVCAGAPAQKWIANRDPDGDRMKIQSLIDQLRTIRAKTFVLVSTIDVFGESTQVDELSEVTEDGLHAYGRNRRDLEVFAADQFERCLTVRLPGLVGPGLRKNAIYDLYNANNVQAIDSRGVFQFYPMVNLWSDIQSALRAGLSLIHLTSEPISIAMVAEEGFNAPFCNHLDKPVARYDMRTRHAGVFGRTGNYQYDRRDVLTAVRSYVQSEPKTAGASK